MKKIQFWNLITNTFQKEIRNKSFLFLSVMTILIVLMVNGVMDLVMNMVEGEMPMALPGIIEKKMIVFYSIISFWSGILANYMGVNCVRSDFDSHVAMQLLAFPLRREEYLLARILGALGVVVSYYVISLLLAFIVFSWGPSVSFGAGPSSILFSLLVSCLSMLVLITLGVFFSLFMAKMVSFLSLIFLSVCITFANSYFAERDFSFQENFGQGVIKSLGTILHWFFPRLGTVNNLSRDILNDNELGIKLSAEIIHFASSYGILLFLLIFLFRKRDFSSTLQE